MNDAFRLATRDGRTVAEFPDAVPAARDRPFIVPVFLPQAGCPHRCLYCDQQTITGTNRSLGDPRHLAREIRRFLGHRGPHRRQCQIAFYGGTFLNLPPTRRRQLLDMAAAFVHANAADGLRFSTRPDSVTPESLAQIAPYPVQTVELGVQSMDNRVLARSRRGHNAQATRMAVAYLRKTGYEIGLQMMIGLPGDSAAGALATAQAIADLRPAFVRIYPTLVLPGSDLAHDFRAGRYQPMDLDDSVTLTCRLLRLFSARGVRVVRMGLPAEIRPPGGRDLPVGPLHPSYGEMVYHRLYLELATAALVHARGHGAHVRLKVNPKRLSALTGHRRANVHTLQHNFRLQQLSIVSEVGLPLNRLEVDMLPAL